jgi:hypothetical protein
MTTGALIFAFNNEHIDYVKMAAWNAANIRRHLNIPVAVVTDVDSEFVRDQFDTVVLAQPDAGGTRYFSDYNKTVTWNNAGRTSAYALTPWDQTLVLDADYVVATDSLASLFAAPSDFMCHRHSMNIATGNRLTEHNTFGRYQMPMAWATVMLFRRSNIANYIFESMHMVRNNWQHYRNLYGIDRPTYRNDHALSIAIGIVSGHTGSFDYIPWDLVTTLPEHMISKVDTDFYQVEWKNTQARSQYVSVRGLDIHVMGKSFLENIVDSES